MEAPHFKALQEKYASRGFTILAVNAWNEPKEMVQEFAKKNSLNYSILLDGKQVFRDDYGGKAIPHSFLLDKQGKIVWSQIGWGDELTEVLEKKIEELLAE